MNVEGQGFVTRGKREQVMFCWFFCLCLEEEIGGAERNSEVKVFSMLVNQY